MKQLNTYIQEGLFDNIGVGITEESIKTWINEHFVCQNLKLDLDNNKWIANAESVRQSTPITIKADITSLTNGNFTWGNINGEFNVNWCPNLINLEGAPRKCDHFYCGDCNKLVSLEGVEKMKCRVFYCCCCKNLKSLKGAPKYSPEFRCDGCEKLTSLNRLGKVEIFFCDGCPKITEKYTEEQIKKITGANIVKL